MAKKHKCLKLNYNNDNLSEFLNTVSAGIELSPEATTAIEAEVAKMGLSEKRSEAEVARLIKHDQFTQAVTEYASVVDANVQAMEMALAGETAPGASEPEFDESAAFREDAQEEAASKGFDPIETTPAGEFVNPLKGIQVPELVQLAKDLLGGNLPQAKANMRQYLGVFRSQEGFPASRKILINTGIAENEQQLAAVLAHEIGHLIDYLDDATLKRGNILGRIASLRKHMANFMADKPGGPGELTDQDRQRLRNLAKRMARSGAEVWVDEEITKEWPVTPQQVLDIWNTVDVSKLNPALTQYIKTLSAAEKKSIIFAAIKNKLPEHIQKFASKTTEKTGKKVKQVVEINEEEIAAKYEELIAEELAKRELLSRETIHDELVELTRWWSGDWKGGTKKYIAYRTGKSNGDKELYAEAMSVLLNSPGDLQKRAPMFWRGYSNYIGEKPDVLRAYLAVQEMLNGTPEKLAVNRSRWIRDMHKKGDDAMRAAETARKAARLNPLESIKQWLEQYVLQTHSPSIAIQKEAESSTSIRTLKPSTWLGGKKEPVVFSDTKNAYYALDELHTIDAKNHVMMARIEREVYTPLLESDITRDDMGEYLFLKRVVNERNEIINPLGFTPKTAGEQIGQLKKRLGNDKFRQLHQAMQEWHEIIFEVAIDAVDSGVYSLKDFNETIEPNRHNYATFAVAHYLENDPRISASLFKQVGTFEDIANAIDATHMKMMTLRRLVELNQAKTTLVDELLLKEARDEIEEIKIPNNKSKPSKSAPQGFDYIILLRNGKPHAYQVRQAVADQFLKSNIGGLLSAAKLLQTATYKIFHPMYVTFSPAFIAKNMERDGRRTLFNMKIQGGKLAKEVKRAALKNGETKKQANEAARKMKIGYFQILVSYWKSRGNAWRVAHGVYDATVEQMIGEHAIDIPFVKTDPESVGREKKIGGKIVVKGQTDIILEGYGLGRFSKLPDDRNKAIKLIKGLGDVIKGTGIFQETISKVAAYKLLTERGVPVHKKAEIVRKFAGTPDYKQRSLASDILNGSFMYFRVRVNGLTADVGQAFDKDTRGAWMLQRLIWTVLPIAITEVARRGLPPFGEGTAEMFRHIPKYFIENYDVIPVGLVDSDDDDDDEKKVLFFTIPQDDTSRFIGQVWQLAMKMGISAYEGEEGEDIPNLGSEIADAVAGEIGSSFSPLIDITHKWQQFARGHSPRDTYYQSDILSPKEFSAGKSPGGRWYGRKKMISWTIDKTGVAGDAWEMVEALAPEPIFGSAFESEPKSATERALKWAPGLNSLLRVSDRGLSEKEWSRVEAEESEADVFKLRLPPKAQQATKDLYYLRRKKELSTQEYGEKEVISAWYNQAYLPLTDIMKGDDADATSAARKELEEVTTNMDAEFGPTVLLKLRLTLGGKGRPRQGSETDAEYAERYEEWVQTAEDASEFLESKGEGIFQPRLVRDAPSIYQSNDSISKMKSRRRARIERNIQRTVLGSRKETGQFPYAE